MLPPGFFIVFTFVLPFYVLQLLFMGDSDLNMLGMCSGLTSGLAIDHGFKSEERTIEICENFVSSRVCCFSIMTKLPYLLLIALLVSSLLLLLLLFWDG